MNSSPDRTCRRFLLGLASEEDQYGVEEAVLASALDSLTLQIAEDELIEDYLLGALTEDEKRGFEQQFLITEERRQKLRFASALIKYSQETSVEDHSTVRKPLPRVGVRVILFWKHTAFLAAAASILLAIVAGLELVKVRRQAQVAQETRSELTQLQTALAADNRPSHPVLEPSTGSLRGAKGVVDRMPMIEFASATRTVVPPKFRIPPDAQFARIDLKLSAPFAEEYREVLLSGAGRQLWAQEFPAAALSPEKRSSIVLPASILTPGAYHLLLDRESTKGRFEELTDCVFLVVRE